MLAKSESTRFTLQGARILLSQLRQKPSETYQTAKISRQKRQKNYIGQSDFPIPQWMSHGLWWLWVLRLINHGFLTIWCSSLDPFAPAVFFRAGTHSSCRVSPSQPLRCDPLAFGVGRCNFQILPSEASITCPQKSHFWWSKLGSPKNGWFIHVTLWLFNSLPWKDPSIFKFGKPW